MHRRKLKVTGTDQSNELEQAAAAPGGCPSATDEEEEEEDSEEESPGKLGDRMVGRSKPPVDKGVVAIAVEAEAFSLELIMMSVLQEKLSDAIGGVNVTASHLLICTTR